MTTFLVPTSVINPTSGETVPLPGHASYVAGTDVSDALLYWLTTNNGGIGADGYCGMSGASSLAPNTIQFREEDYWFEYGTVWGLAQNQSSYTDRSGYVWPQVKQHAWRHLIIDGNGCTWVQEDNTSYDDGLVDKTAATVAGDGTTVTLASPLSESQIARLRAATGSVPAISGTTSGGTGGLFTRKSGTGGVGSRAQIASCADDGTTVTLAEGNTCNETLAAADVVIYLGAREGRRNDKLWMFATASPGAKNGVERSWINQNLTLRNLTVRMGNTAGATSVFTAREQWHLFRLRGIDGLTIESTVRGEDIWGDIINTGQTAQNGVKNAPLHAENVSVAGIYTSCGRHAITGQGHIGLDVSNAIFRDIGRLGWDSETTADSARVFDTVITDSLFDPGTVMWHQSPATMSGEPPRTMSVTTTSGSDRITIAYDLLNGDDLGASITGTGIPSGSYLRRRMSPTEFELNTTATASGTVTATIGSAVPFRDFTCQYVDCSSGSWNFAGNTACIGSRVYFTGTTVSGSPIISDVQWESRIDGNTYTTADIDTKVFSVGAGILTKNDVPSSVTSTTVTMPANATATVDGTDATLTCTVTANDRTMTTSDVFFTTAHKGRTVTGTGIRTGTTIVSINGAKSVELSQPASASSTSTVTVGGRARFYAQIGPAKWDGYTIENCRVVGTGKWSGSSGVWTLQGQPLILMPTDCTNVTVRRNMMTGQRNASNQVVRYGFGYFTPPATVTMGADPASTTTFAQNRFVDMVDNQASTPTVTSTVTLSGTGLTAARPSFIATVAFSDSRQERGSIVFYRGTTRAGAVPIVSGTNTATFTPYVDSPVGNHSWTAVWTGSWDTLEDTSNAVTQSYGSLPAQQAAVDEFVVTPSPSDEGDDVTLTVNFTPGQSPDGETVVFTDETNIFSPQTLGTATVTDGVAELVVSGLIPGTYSFFAEFFTTAEWIGVDSGVVSHTVNEVIVDRTPPEVSAQTPAPGAEYVDLDATVTMTFSESVTNLAFVLRDANGQSVSGALTGSGTGWTFTPTESLLPGRTYTAVLDDAIDTNLNHLAGRVSWTFTTDPGAEYVPTGLLTAQPA